MACALTSAIFTAVSTNPNAGSNDLNACANACCKAGFNGPGDFAGVEYGCQCFCGHALSNSAQKVADSECDQACPGNHSEKCGGSDRISVFQAKCQGTCTGPPAPPPPPPPPPPGPEFHGCNVPAAAGLPFCNIKLSHAARVADMVGRLTMDEKIALLSPTQAPFCACHTAAIDRVGIPRYKWLTEVNSCVNTACLGEGRCPTTFVGPTGMAASFNRTSWFLKGDVISTEMRAVNNKQGSDVGLTGWV